MRAHLFAFVRTYRLPLLLAGLVLTAAGILYFVPIGSRTAVLYSDSDVAFNRAYWKQELARRGPTAAYAEFKERNQNAPEGRQHFAAHVMGALLGEESGPNGIVHCDAQFGFGCYHGFFSEVIATGGTALVKELDAACVEAYGPGGTGCQHGIGHGILEYVGYEKIDEALTLCGQTTELAPLLGCASGVFMENDFRLAQAVEGESPSARPFDSAHPYAPCDRVSAYMPACYVELGQWYVFSMLGNEKAGTLCAALPAGDRTYCFMGVGSAQVASGGYMPESVLTQCAAHAPQDELSCRAGAWWGFAQVPEQRMKADTVCAYADAQKRQTCRTLGDLSGGLVLETMDAPVR